MAKAHGEGVRFSSGGAALQTYVQEGVQIKREKPGIIAHLLSAGGRGAGQISGWPLCGMRHSLERWNESVHPGSNDQQAHDLINDSCEKPLTLGTVC